MKISFKQTGGFAGITINKQLDVPNSDLDLVRKLVQQIVSLPKGAPTGLPDMTQYHFEIEDDGQQLTVDVDDGSAQEVHQELVKFVMDHA